MLLCRQLAFLWYQIQLVGNYFLVAYFYTVRIPDQQHTFVCQSYGWDVGNGYFDIKRSTLTYLSKLHNDISSRPHIFSLCYLQIGLRGDHGVHVQYHVVVVTNLVQEPVCHVEFHQQVVLGQQVKHKVATMQNVQVKD